MMKPDGIKRAVKTVHKDRVAGDAPNLGKVARMPGTGIPKGERRRRKRGERSSRKTQSKGGRVFLNWVLLIAVVAAILGGLAITRAVKRGSTAGTQTGPRLEIEMTELEDSSAGLFVSPTEAEALALVKAALEVKDVSQVSRFFDVGKQAPEDVLGFLKGLEVSDGKFSHMTWMSNVDANGLNLEGVLVFFDAEDGQKNRIAFLRPDEALGWRVDFESFARIVSPGWTELSDNKVERGVVRVLIARDFYYNGPFRDEAKWVCYGMVSPDTKQVFQGYCEVGSPVALALEAIVSKSQSVNRATLEIGRVKDGLMSQFQITRVVAEDWVVGPVDFDQGFR